MQRTKREPLGNSLCGTEEELDDKIIQYISKFTEVVESS